ncbi:MAG: ferritin family protein [Myxococcales bacterium]
MDAKTTELVNAIRTALQAERTGYEFYKMAAANTKDPEGQKTFEELAAEEQSHFDFLRKHYLSLMETGELSKDARLSKAKDLGDDHPIFSADLKSRIKGAHFEMSALAIAAQLELNGINHYREQAARAASPEARKLFQQLVDWETGHYEAFIRQQQQLQEAYWGEAGFAPF